MLGRNTSAAVVHVDAHHPTRAPRAQADRPAARRVGQRIRQQVPKYLPDTLPIGLDQRQVVLGADLYVDLLLVGARLHRLSGRREHRVGVERLALERELARLGQRQVLQIIHELAEQHRLFVQRVDHFWPRFGYAIAHRFEIAAQVC